MKKLLILGLSALIVFSSCTSTYDSSYEAYDSPKYIQVKYRDDSVNVNSGGFLYSDMSKSSFVGDAWYDEDEEYMIIQLSDSYYHYCDIGLLEWYGLIGSESHGSFYNSNIKGSYNCRNSYIPTY
jgi:hypothetical protein